MNFGETISNNDLNASHYYLLDGSQLDAGSLIPTEINGKISSKNTKENDAREEYIRLVTI